MFRKFKINVRYFIKHCSLTSCNGFQLFPIMPWDYVFGYLILYEKKKDTSVSFTFFINIKEYHIHNCNSTLGLLTLRQQKR